jgi:hypothetical protein
LTSLRRRSRSKRWPCVSPFRSVFSFLTAELKGFRTLFVSLLARARLVCFPGGRVRGNTPVKLARNLGISGFAQIRKDHEGSIRFLVLSVLNQLGACQLHP